MDVDVRPSAKKRTQEAIENFGTYIDTVPVEVTVISLVASGIKRSTTANYVSKIRMIARFINALSQEQHKMLGVKAIPQALIDIDVNAINLEIAVAQSVTPHFFTQLLGARADRGLTGNTAMRCALQKAQKLAGCPEWANSATFKERSALAERMAERRHPGNTPVGAITEEMLEDMIDVTEHPHAELLAQLWRAEFHGCFRFNEIFNLTKQQIQPTGVSLREDNNKLDKPTQAKGVNSNTVRKRSRENPDKPMDPSQTSSIYFKHLAGRPSGLKALEILQAIAETKKGDERLFPTSALAYKCIMGKIKEAQAKLQWPTDLRFGTHGLRHGGVHNATHQLGGSITEIEAEALLCMSGDMIDHYKRTNIERTAHAAHMSDKLSRDPEGKLHICCANVAVEFNPHKDSPLDIMNKFPEVRQQVMDKMPAPRFLSRVYSVTDSLDFFVSGKPYGVWRRERFATQANASKDHPKPPEVIDPPATINETPHTQTSTAGHQDEWLRLFRADSRNMLDSLFPKREQTHT